MPEAPLPDGLARALGWFSLGLAAPPLVAPGAFTDALAVGSGPRQHMLARAVGGRELAAGLLLLTGARRTGLWSRVAGDAIDLGLLARALRDHDGRGLPRTVAATAAVGVITAVDGYAALRAGRAPRTTELTAATTVARTPDEVFAFWRSLENLPRFMAHVEQVRDTGGGTSRWRVRAPFGRTVEWDARITRETPGRGLSWRSADGSRIDNRGSVEFSAAPGGRGTEVRVRISYRVPAGRLGRAVARYFGEEPHQQLDDDLRRLKQVLETGEVMRSDGAPGGKRARAEFPQHPARPLSDAEYAREVQG